VTWIRLGRAVRALRRRLGWRQRDLAVAVGVSQALVSRVERGHGDVVLPRTIEAIARSLGARLVTYVDWNGEALDRLLDAEHASLVEAVVRVLRAASWEVQTEATFAIRGERGSVDVLAFHRASRSLLVIEVKSVLADAQETQSRLDRKVRLAAQIGPADWRPSSISALLVMADTRTNRRHVARLSATFGAAYPDRAVEVRAFVRAPASRAGDADRAGRAPLRGLWFLTSSTAATARHRVRRN
jgi:transcriptional regulator with XRE-family HTH domain